LQKSKAQEVKLGKVVTGLWGDGNNDDRCSEGNIRPGPFYNSELWEVREKI